MTDTAILCPRCQGPMATFERAGVQVDQCTNCRGIFLDRGELERLLEAETSYYQQPTPAYPAQPPAYPPQPAPGYYQDEHHGYDDEHHGHHGQHEEYDEHRGYGRRRSLFHDLFE